MSDEQLGTQGDRIRFCREKLDLKIRELAEKSGVGVSAIGEIEQKRTKRSTDIHKLAAALNVSVHWLADGIGPMNLPEPDWASSGTELEIRERPLVVQRDNSILIPHLEVAGSMGPGMEAGTGDFIRHIRVDLQRLRREVSFSSPENLRIITGYGDSMYDTFSDGDPIMMDVGVHAITIDGVYVYEKETRALGDLFIKRVQRQPIDNTLIISSDNPRYRQTTIISEDEFKDHFVLHGRALIAWNARKL